MSEVIDRPKTATPPKNEESPIEPKQPIKYVIEAWTTGIFCSGKFVMVAVDIFKIAPATANELARQMSYHKKVPVALGLTKDVAEAKSHLATKKMEELVDGCVCGSAIKFVPVPQE